MNGATMVDSAGRQAGATLLPYASAQGIPWFVSDWGTLTVNPMARKGHALKQDDVLDFAVPFVVHDGDVGGVCLYFTT